MLFSIIRNIKPDIFFNDLKLMRIKGYDILLLLKDFNYLVI